MSDGDEAHDDMYASMMNASDADYDDA